MSTENFDIIRSMGAQNSKLLNRAVTRDLPLFMVSASYGDHLNHMAEQAIGFPLCRNFVLLERGTAVIHRDNDLWYTEMPGKWAAAFRKKQQLDRVKQTIDETAHSITSLESFTPEASQVCLLELRTIIANGTLGMIFAHWVPIFNEQKLAAYDQAEVRYFEASRQRIEMFFSLAADACYSFLETLAVKYKTDAALLKYATHDELDSLIRTSNISTRELANRKRRPLLFIEDELYIGSEVNEYLDRFGYQFDRPQSLKVTTLKGTSACGGLVTGKVQVITSREDFGQFEEGSILVAPMTSPEYSLLIQKASAIITDEGGILSHAAIVSRELNKPCIIGTKHASYLLKNFQEVEVDAERGVVTVLR